MRSIIVLLLTCFIGGSVYSQKINTIVEDKIGLLTEEQRNSLVDRINALDKEGITRLVIYIDSKSELPIFDMAQKIYDENKIGTKEDEGVLILVLKDDRKVRIHTGYGMEDVLPDVICERIIRNIITPEFKKGNFFEGLDMAVNEIEKSFKNKDEQKVESTNESDNKNSPSLWFIAFFIAQILYLFHLIFDNINNIVLKYKFRKILDHYSDKVFFRQYEDEWKKIKYQFFFEQDMGDKQFTLFYYHLSNHYNVISSIVNNAFELHKKYVSEVPIDINNIDELKSYSSALSVINSLHDQSFYSNLERIIEHNVKLYEKAFTAWEKFFDDSEDINIKFNTLKQNIYTSADHLQKSIESSIDVWNTVKLNNNFKYDIDSFVEYITNLNDKCNNYGIYDICGNIEIAELYIIKLLKENPKYFSNISDFQFEKYKNLIYKDQLKYYRNLTSKSELLASEKNKYDKILESFNFYEDKIVEYISKIEKIDKTIKLSYIKSNLENKDISVWNDELNKVQKEYNKIKSQYEKLKKKEDDKKRESSSYTSSYSSSYSDTTPSSSSWSSSSNDSSNNSSSDSYDSGGGDSGGGGADGGW